MNYGKVKCNGRYWSIQCEPHVRARIKRVFPRATQAAGDTVMLSVTPEHSRELEWFLIRYPMHVDSPKALKRSAQDHRDQEERLADLLEARTPPTQIMLAKPPRDYQNAVPLFLAVRGGLLLADDVGLGKTVSAICCIVSKGAPAIVVCPAHMPRQWEAMLKEFAPDLRVHRVRRGRPYDLATKGDLFAGTMPDVLVISYHMLRGWADKLAGVARLAVFDECQQLRNPGSDIFDACKHLAGNTPLKIGLSATPIYNYGSEFFYVIDTLLPDAMGTREEFLREWCTAGGNKARIQDTEDFGAYLRRSGIMLRRTRAEVGRELPPLTKVVHELEADDSVLKNLDGEAVNLARIVLAHNENAVGERMRASGMFDAMLRQATGVTKAPFVAEFVKLLADSGEKIVLYGWHREVYGIWMERLKHLNPVMYTGSESNLQKHNAVQEFIRSPTCKVLIMSLRSGAGVDGLQGHAHIAVFGELDWSPGVHEQCLDEKTEVLTRHGFKGVNSIDKNDLVAGFDINTSAVEWRPIIRFVDRPISKDESMFGISTATIDLRVTGEHRLVFRHRQGSGHKRNSQWKFGEASKVAKRSQAWDMPVAGLQIAVGLQLTDDEIRFIGWFLTDGNINYASRQVTIAQAEASPFIKNIEQCLAGCGMHYGIARTEAGTGSQFIRRSALLRYYIPKFGPKEKRSNKSKGWARLEPYLDKSLSPLMESINEQQLAILLEAINMGDGAKSIPKDHVRRGYNIGTGNKDFAERLQSLCVRRGWRANLSQRFTCYGKPHYQLLIRQRPIRSIGGTSRKDRQFLKKVHHVQQERVWCVENDLGTIFVRRNGKVAIVGNCAGRLHRDGQVDPVTAYFMTIEDGADPVMVDVLGIKREQIEGVRNPGGALVQRIEDGEAHIKRLAREFMERRGELVPAAVTTITPSEV